MDRDGDGWQGTLWKGWQQGLVDRKVAGRTDGKKRGQIDGKMQNVWMERKMENGMHRMQTRKMINHSLSVYGWRWVMEQSTAPLATTPHPQLPSPRHMCQDASTCTRWVNPPPTPPPPPGVSQPTPLSGKWQHYMVANNAALSQKLPL